MSSNQLLKRLLSGFLPLGCLVLVGCGGDKSLAPVSGTVTMDGKPYPNAVVIFQPMATKGNEAPGRGSSGKTDKEGRFVLKQDGIETGAVIGKHRVRIVTDGIFTGVNPIDQEGGSDDYTPPGSVKADPIPAEWHGNSTKEFDVTAKGTDQANFDIVTTKKKK